MNGNVSLAYFDHTYWVKNTNKSGSKFTVYLDGDKKRTKQSPTFTSPLPYSLWKAILSCTTLVPISGNAKL